MLQDTTDRNTSVPMSAPDRSSPHRGFVLALDKDEAEVLFWQKMLEPFDRYGRMDVNAYMESFIRV